MKTFRQLNEELFVEAKMTYDQQYSIHQSQIKMLQDRGYSRVSSGTKDPKNPDLVRSSYSRYYGSWDRITQERVDYQSYVSFSHNNMTRENTNFTGSVTRTVGSDSRTGSPKKIHADVSYRTLKSAIKGVEDVILESLQNDFADLVKRIADFGPENAKSEGLHGALNLFSRYMRKSFTTNAEIFKFMEKIDKLGLKNLSKARDFAKKTIKKL